MRLLGAVANVTFINALELLHVFVDCGVMILFDRPGEQTTPFREHGKGTAIEFDPMALDLAFINHLFSVGALLIHVSLLKEKGVLTRVNCFEDIHRPHMEMTS